MSSLCIVKPVQSINHSTSLIASWLGRKLDRLCLSLVQLCHVIQLNEGRTQSVNSLGNLYTLWTSLLTNLQAIYHFMVEFHRQTINDTYKGNYDDVLYLFAFFYHKIHKMHGNMNTNEKSSILAKSQVHWNCDNKYYTFTVFLIFYEVQLHF